MRAAAKQTSESGDNMEDSDLLSLDDESSGKFFYVGDDVTLNVIPGVALVLVGALCELPVHHLRPLII